MSGNIVIGEGRGIVESAARLDVAARLLAKDKGSQGNCLSRPVMALVLRLAKFLGCLPADIERMRNKFYEKSFNVLLDKYITAEMQVAEAEKDLGGASVGPDDLHERVIVAQATAENASAALTGRIQHLVRQIPEFSGELPAAAAVRIRKSLEERSLVTDSMTQLLKHNDTEAFSRPA